MSSSGTSVSFSTSRNRIACAHWLDRIAKWEVAFTLTFTKRKSTNYYRSVSDIADTTRELILQINRACFNHGVNRKGYRVASAFVVEHGYGGRHPHVHGTISLPPNYDYESICRVIKNRARSLHSIDQQIHLQQYKSFGWFAYGLKTGTDNLVVEDICQANP